MERPTSQGAAGVHPAGAAATGACRSRHPLSMVEPTQQSGGKFTRPADGLDVACGGGGVPSAPPAWSPCTAARAR